LPRGRPSDSPTSIVLCGCWSLPTRPRRSAQDMKTLSTTRLPLRFWPSSWVPKPSCAHVPPAAESRGYELVSLSPPVGCRPRRNPSGRRRWTGRVEAVKAERQNHDTAAAHRPVYERDREQPGHDESGGWERLLQYLGELTEEAKLRTELPPTNTGAAG